MNKRFSLHLLTIKILSIINILIILGLWITGYMSGLSPERWGWLGLMGYAFPFFIVATVIFIVMWILLRLCSAQVIKIKYILISFIGLLVAYFPLSLYCPINILATDSEKSDSLTLKLLSYNTCNWGIGSNTGFAEQDLTNEDKYLIMIDYFKSVDADLVAIQEGILNENLDTLKNIYHYTDTVKHKSGNGGSVLLMSKYPIVRKENINIESKGNCAGAFWVNIPQLDSPQVKSPEIIVIVTHLESMRFSVVDKEKFSYMVHGKEENKDSVKRTSKTIFSKILAASKIRAKQAEQIAGFIKTHKNLPIIVMGDFNDIPQSYTHALISDQLEDCYQKKGFGPGYTFKHFGMRVRIDNILCSKNFTPLSCKVDYNIALSDHQPIIATVKY